MDTLELIAKNTERLIKEFHWTEYQRERFIETANLAVSKMLAKRSKQAINEETDNSLVVHEATYSGAFILFGGWTQIYDSTIPSGTRGHELYLAFGGVGVGGWSGDCDIELMTEGTFTWFHDKVESFAFMYLPILAQPIPVFVYFDSSSTQIGLSVPDYSLSIGVGGGTVSVKS